MKLSLNKTKWTDLSAMTRAFIFSYEDALSANQEFLLLQFVKVQSINAFTYHLNYGMVIYALTYFYFYFFILFYLPQNN